MTHLLVYGDSNTHGTLAMPSLEASGALGPEDRWAGRLAAALGDGWRVTVEGLPGRTCVHDDPVEGEWKNGLRVLPAILQSHAPVDIVAVMLGTNDLKARFSLSGLDVALGAGRLLDEIARLAPEARRLLICPPPVREGGIFAELFAGAERRGASLAASMERTAHARDTAFFDAGGVIAVDPVDGIHLDAAAHATLAQSLVPVLRSLVT